jgi:hypothetical protein
MKDGQMEQASGLKAGKLSKENFACRIVLVKRISN